MPVSLERGELTARARALVVAPWNDRRRWLYLAADVGLALAAAGLSATGYPGPRVAVVAAAALAWSAVHASDLRAGAADPPSGWAALRDASLFVAGCAVVAVTGAVRSPFLPAAVALLPLRLFRHGWTARTRRFWGAAAVAAATLALLPRGWAGPPVAEPLAWALAAGSLALVAAATILYLALLTRVAHESVREATRAREELTLQALARARELEQVGAQLSHELKNPLSAIKTLVQLSARAVQDAASRERLEVVEAEIRRMQQILQDHLSFARPLEKLRPEELELAAVVDDVLALLAGRAAEAKVALRGRGAARVVADPLRLKEALLNLVVNALEASPAGSRVEVEVSQQGGTARVAVRDFGRGMPEEVLARVGTPFFTTREEGTGLGVALARAAFVHHGGALEYASRPGEGTTATATLPAAVARRADGARARGG